MRRAGAVLAGVVVVGVAYFASRPSHPPVVPGDLARLSGCASGGLVLTHNECDGWCSDVADEDVQLEWGHGGGPWLRSGKRRVALSLSERDEALLAAFALVRPLGAPDLEPRKLKRDLMVLGICGDEPTDIYGLGRQYEFLWRELEPRQWLTAAATNWRGHRATRLFRKLQARVEREGVPVAE